MRWMMIAVAVTAVVICLLLPLLLPISAADRRRMAAYEWLGSNRTTRGLTKAQVIRLIGPPSSQYIPESPDDARLYTWVAEFESSFEYRKYQLNLQIDRNDEVVGKGLFWTKSQGLEGLLIHVGVMPRWGKRVL